METPERHHETSGGTGKIRARVLTLFAFIAALSVGDREDVEGVKADAQPIVTVHSGDVKLSPLHEPSGTKMENPLICINGRFKDKDKINPRIEKALTEAGARVERIHPDNFDILSPWCRGAFVVGGADMDTTKIPQEAPVHPMSRRHLIPLERQVFDKRFIGWARSNKVPLFGECLGMQEVGVWEGEGARLNQHIPDQPNMLDHRKPHQVLLGERADVFGLGPSPEVSSRHHQALEEPLPDTLEVVGRSRDKIIEAVISTDGLFWGIQWHPRAGSEEVRIYWNFVEMVREKSGSDL